MSERPAATAWHGRLARAFERKRNDAKNASLLRTGERGTSSEPVPRRSRKQPNDLKPALLFLAPNLIGFILFMIGPMVFSLVVSFTNWDLQRAVPFGFTGLDNFRRLMHDADFWRYFVNTIYLMLGLPISIAGSLLLAILLSRKMRGMPIYRTIFYLPTFTAGVAMMLLWKNLYNPEYGPINISINAAFQALHIGAHAPAWLQSTHNLAGLAVEHVGFTRSQFGLGAKDALINMSIWTAIGGNNMLLYLAAITNISPDLYEAAELDGAGKWASFWNVTWPQLMPTTFFIVVMTFIAGVQGGFEQAKVMTDGKPAGTTISLAYYIYIKAFEEFQMGYASAIAWLMFAIIFAMTLTGWKFGAQAVEDL
jgi:multiple sugar transport system permease protein